MLKIAKFGISAGADSAKIENNAAYCCFASQFLLLLQPQAEACENGKKCKKINHG
jgi:hypothetical protein